MTFVLIAMLLFADPPQGQPRTFEAVSRQAEAARDANDAAEAATVYCRLKRKPDGDKERVIVLRLNAEKQAREPGVAVK